MAMITFNRASGGTARGYLAEAADPKAPGVLVIQEWWGLQGQIQATCEQLAKDGFTALAPDLYEGKVVPYHDSGAASAAMNALDFKVATGEVVRGAAKHLAARGPKVGITGFCMGGAVTVIAAAQLPEVSAAVCFYGLPPGNVAGPKDVRVPLQGHFADQDDWIKPEMVDAFEKGLKEAGKTFEVYRYHAHHAFMNSERKDAYSAEAAKQAWPRCIAWLKQHLG
ncbi:MAG: dienelactone hydrolase family protein [Anaeromyxobacteraceae bacterium]